MGRIFRDYGHVPGLDVAFIKNGYVYHTDADTCDRIPDGSIQRSGDNILAVVKKLAISPDHVLGINQDNHPPVFFDLFGLYVVSYPSWCGGIINCLTSLVALAYMRHDVKVISKKTDISRVRCEKYDF